MQAKSELTARTDALCNATLLNSSFQRCGLNSGEEAARTDLTRMEDSLETLRRRAANATARVRPLMHEQPTDPVATPSCSENSTGTANGHSRGPHSTAHPAQSGSSVRFGRAAFGGVGMCPTPQAEPCCLPLVSAHVGCSHLIGSQHLFDSFTQNGS